MVVSPLLRGMFGLATDAKLELSPSLRTFRLTGVRWASTMCVLAKINCNWTLRGPRKESFWKRVAPRARRVHHRISSGHQFARDGAKGGAETANQFRSEWKATMKTSM